MDGPLWLDKTKAAKLFGVSRYTILKWARAGDISVSPKRKGFRQMVYIPSVQAYLEGVGNG